MRCMKCGTVIQSGTICPHCGNDTSVKESIEFTEDLQQETVETEAIEDVKVNVPEDKPAVQTPKAFTKEAQNEKALVEAMEKFVFYSVLISVIGNLSSIYSFFTGAVYRKSGVAFFSSF